MNIVTLLPSATEIICQLGLENHLVGVSHECDFPLSVKNLPKVTSTRVDHSATSREIHRSVSELLKNAVSVYDLDLELLKSLKPDYLITQDLCDVCAVSYDQVEDACNQYLGPGTQVISLKPKTLNDIWDDIHRVGKTLNTLPSYQSFKETVDQTIRMIQNTIPPQPPTRPSILTVEWFQPVMIGGLWVPEMIDIIGGQCLMASPGQPAPTVSKDALSKIRPDVVIIKPCGFKLEQTLQEMDLLKSTLPWEQWEVHLKGNAYLVDGNAYFNRPGPRILDSLKILAYCTHPTLFPEFGKQYSDAVIRLEPNLTVSSQK